MRFPVADQLIEEAMYPTCAVPRSSTPCLQVDLFWPHSKEHMFGRKSQSLWDDNIKCSKSRDPDSLVLELKKLLAAAEILSQSYGKSSES